MNIINVLEDFNYYLISNKINISKKNYLNHIANNFFYNLKFLKLENLENMLSQYDLIKYDIIDSIDDIDLLIDDLELEEGVDYYCYEIVSEDYIEKHYSFNLSILNTNHEYIETIAVRNVIKEYFNRYEKLKTADIEHLIKNMSL